MADSNPYSSPNAESVSNEDSTSPSPRPSRLAFYIVPAIVGAVIGSVFFAPFTRSVGDPNGHSIGAGLGGLVALFLGFMARIAVRRRKR